MKKLIIAAALSVGLMASLHASTPDDLILGFRATGGTGAGTNLEIDLGSISNFVNATGTLDLGSLLDSSTLGVGNTIDSVYGSDWGSRSDLTWGLAAANNGVVASGPDGEVAKTVWLSSVANGSLFDGTASSTPVPGTASSLQGTATQKIGTVYAGFAGTAQTISESNSASWTSAEGSTAKIFGTAFSRSLVENTTNIAGNNGQYVASDLYSVAPVLNQPGTFLGTVKIDSTGEVSFAAGLTAVPEPATYAAFLGLGALGFTMIRRRRQVAA